MYLMLCQFLFSLNRDVPDHNAGCVPVLKLAIQLPLAKLFHATEQILICLRTCIACDPQGWQSDRLAC